MPIADSYEPLKSSANGSTQDFSFDFYIGSTSNLRIYEEDDVTLVQTLKALTTDYTATFDDETPGGNVHFLVAPAAGKSIIRAREIPKTQEVPLKTSKGFQALVLQNIVDKLTALVQDVSEAVNRAVKLPLGTTVTAVTLPEPEDDSLIAWDGVAGAMKNLAADDFIGATGPVGPQGPQGIQGPQGDQGIQGPAGAVATVDTDGTMAANSDSVVPSQKAVRTYVAAEIPDYNSKAEAEEGTLGTGIMPPLRVAQAIAALASGGKYYKSASMTRDLSLATADVTYTGIGFTPKAILMQGTVAATKARSEGSATTTQSSCIFCNGDTGNVSYQDVLMNIAVSSGTSQLVTLKSVNSDGFVLTWTNQNSPTGTGAYSFFVIG